MGFRFGLVTTRSPATSDRYYPDFLHMAPDAILAPHPCTRQLSSPAIITLRITDHILGTHMDTCRRYRSYMPRTPFHISSPVISHSEMWTRRQSICVWMPSSFPYSTLKFDESCRPRFTEVGLTLVLYLGHFSIVLGYHYIIFNR
jgi:hypothetical protein